VTIFALMLLTIFLEIFKMRPMQRTMNKRKLFYRVRKLKNHFVGVSNMVWNRPSR